MSEQHNIGFDNINTGLRSHIFRTDFLFINPDTYILLMVSIRFRLESIGFNLHIFADSEYFIARTFETRIFVLTIAPFSALNQSNE